MPHLHTEPGQHDLCASAYIVRLDGNEPRVLLHKHKKLGTFIQFGGHVELDENPWRALRHELVEESGYHLEQLSLLQPPHAIKKLTGARLHPMPVVLMTHDFDETHKHTDLEFAFTTRVEPAEAIGEGESKEIQGFTRTELDDPGLAIPDNVRETATFILEVCLESWESVDPLGYEP